MTNDDLDRKLYNCVVDFNTRLSMLEQESSLLQCLIASTSSAKYQVLRQRVQYAQAQIDRLSDAMGDIDYSIVVGMDPNKEAHNERRDSI